MAQRLKPLWRYKSHRVTWKSGSIYTFRYSNFQHDPQPTFLFMNAYNGIHPNTGHQHRYIQGINLSYVPRSMRKKFVKDFIRYMKNKSLTPQISRELIKRKYPYLQHAIRRYFFKPSYYITKVQEIPLDELESVVVSTWSKDFSKKVLRTLGNKLSNIMKTRKKTGGFMGRIFKWS